MKYCEYCFLLCSNDRGVGLACGHFTCEDCVEYFIIRVSSACPVCSKLLLNPHVKAEDLSNSVCLELAENIKELVMKEKERGEKMGMCLESAEMTNQMTLNIVNRSVDQATEKLKKLKKQWNDDIVNSIERNQEKNEIALNENKIVVNSLGRVITLIEQEEDDKDEILQLLKDSYDLLSNQDKCNLETFAVTDKGEPSYHNIFSLNKIIRM